MRVRLEHEGVTLDAWVRKDDIEASSWALGTGGSLSGTVGEPSGRLDDARVPPAPPRAGRILRATPLLAGASATEARATGVTLDVEQSVLVSWVEADRAAISFADRAVHLERLPMWLERADVELR
jgi:hypothetical protein